MDSNLSWLLDGPVWMQPLVRIDLLGELPTMDQMAQDQAAILADPQIASLVADLAFWPAPVINSHKSASHPIHKLVFLADIGLTIQSPEIQAIANRILAHPSPQGPFSILMNIPKAFGGTGEDQLAWALCDAPLSLYALIRFGLQDHPVVERALAYLVNLHRENGWPCAGGPELGKFRGPGRKEDPCPFANLIMLQVLAALPEYLEHPATRAGVESTLIAWETRQNNHPYMFYMGTDFCKLKVPLVWYDLLHVLDVLTRFPWVISDQRIQEMLGILSQKANSQGRFTVESVWLAWKDWEFGQKKAPSRWLTFLSQRILARAAKTPA